MWHPIIAMSEMYEYQNNAIIELEKALYQANLNWIDGKEDVKRIELAIKILKGEE